MSADGSDPIQSPRETRVAFHGNICLLTGVNRIHFKAGKLADFGTDNQRLDEASTYILPVFPGEEERSKWEHMSYEQFRDDIARKMKSLLEGVDPKRCAFIAPAGPIKLRSTPVKVPDGGGLVDQPEHACLRIVLVEIFPQVLVYETQTEASAQSVVVTNALLGLAPLLGRGRHFVAVVMGKTLKASVPQDLLPKGTSVCSIHNNNDFYKLSAETQALPPYKELAQSAEIQLSPLSPRKFPDNTSVVAFDKDGVALRGVTLSLSDAVIRVANPDAAVVIVFFPPKCDASKWMPDDQARILSWEDALGPENKTLTTNIASLVAKTQRVVRFLSETFSETEEDEIATEETTATVSAQRICDLIASRLCVEIRYCVDEFTSSMTPSHTLQMQGLSRPPVHSRLRGVGQTNYPKASRATSAV